MCDGQWKYIVGVTEWHDHEHDAREAHRLRHVANEWADAATNGLQWLRNIRDGISTPEDAINRMEDNIRHCREVNA